MILALNGLVIDMMPVIDVQPLIVYDELDDVVDWLAELLVEVIDDEVDIDICSDENDDRVDYQKLIQ